MDSNSFDKYINRIIDKRYKIENVVGVGGMAYVLKAKDLVTGRDVAVKILSDEFRDDERAVTRFINESKTVAMLDHENIVKVLDVVITDERKYIVMELIDGITLKDYTDRIGTLTWKEAVYYTKQILRALSHAHDKNVIHRDIKPQNVMLLSDGTIKVIDFGIVKVPGAEPITMTDRAIGTVNYISPEQASGGTVDFRTDIYSTGVMLYEMVTGRLPFIADSPVAVAMMQVSNEPLAPREINAQIPVGLEQIILKAMQKRPEDRFVNAAAMLKALDYFTENPDVVFASAAADTGASGAKEKKGEYENAEKKKARLKKYARGSRSMFPIVSGIAAAFAVVAIVFVIVWVLPLFKGAGESDSAMEAIENGFVSAMDKIFNVGEGSGERVTVTSFVGEKYDDNLISHMEDLGFAADAVNYVRNAKYSAGVVVRQDPEPDAIRLRPEGGRLIPVTLYVNMGEEEMRMPDCTLLFVSDAKKIVRGEVNTFTVNELPTDAIQVVEEYHDTYPADYVIRTEPAAGELVPLNDNMQITLYVSKGQKISNTVVPELEGRKLDDAKRLIVSSKLALGKIYYEESAVVDAGVVIKASHSKGEVVAQGITAIDLWVSIGSSVVLPHPDENETQQTTPPTVQQHPEQPSAQGSQSGTTNPPSEPNHEQNNPPSDNNTTTTNDQPSAGGNEPPQPSAPDENGDAQQNDPAPIAGADDIAGLLDMRNGEE